MDISLKQKSSHRSTTGYTTAATAVTLAGRGLEEASLSSCESDVTSLKKYFPGKYIDTWSRGCACKYIPRLYVPCLKYCSFNDIVQVVTGGSWVAALMSHSVAHSVVTV